MKRKPLERHSLKNLTRAMSLGAGLLALSAHGQTIIEVGGASTIGTDVLADDTVPASGNWTVEGGTGVGVFSGLVSATANVITTGDVTLTFDHTYDFEVGWDGGAVFYQVNGGGFTYLAGTAFTANGYDGDTSSATNGSMADSSAWGGTTDVFYNEGQKTVQSVATIAGLTAGDTLEVEFRGGWDEFQVNGPPAWELATVKLTDAGANDILDVDFDVDGPSGFTQGIATAGAWDYQQPTNRFELDGSLTTADQYAPSVAGNVIDLAGANIDVALLPGTSSGLAANDVFTLFDLSGGTTLTGSVGTVSLPGGTWDTTLLETAGTIECVVPPEGLLIYEPFDDLDSNLSGNTPGLGLSGPWSAESLIADRSLSYGKLGYQGGRAVANPGIGNGVINNEISPGTTLTGAGLMADGAELWFSVLIVKHPDTSITTDERTTYFSLGTGVADAFDRIGGGGGSGFTFVVNQGNNGISDRLQLWNNDSDGAGGAEKRSPLGVSWGPEGSTLLLVGKITWGAFDPNPGTAIDNDVFELYVPDKDLNLGSVVATLTGNFDQLGTVDPANAFDTISFAGKRGGTAQNNVPEIDEFRFGATSADVLPLDFADPLLVSTDNASGSGVARVATFDEELYVGTGDIRIVNETTPGTTTITLPDPQVVLSDRTLTITPTVPLSDDTYHIEIDAGALTDRNLNEFAGISDPDLWEFTVDGSPPTVATFVEDTFPLISGISPGQVLTNSSLTYTVTFSEPIDAGTVEIADFAASAGSAPATVDSVTATNDPAVFEVGVSTGGTTGTLTLEIVASAVIADVNGLELDTTTAIPSDNTVNVVDPVANAASLTNDFQGTIASQLNDLAVTDPPGGEGRYFHVSVNEDNAGTGWYCADLPGTGDPAPDGVRNFTGPVVAYKMLGNGSLGDVTTTAGSGGDDGRITYATDDPTFTNDGFGQQQMKLWTTNDPGADLATGAGKDATGNAFVGNYGYRDWKGATGIVDISGMASGSVHIYYGAYGDTPTLKVTLKDADNVGADLVIADAHSIADGGNGDAANNCEYYLAEIDFVSDGVYEYVEYEWTSTNGRGLGTVLTGPAVAVDPFLDWAATGTLGPVTFDGDTNGDGVQDGLAFLLGAADPDVDANAAGLLPTVTETAGGLVLDFDCLPIADRGTATLNVQHSNDLGTWTPDPGVLVPDASGGPTDGVTFVVGPGPVGPPALNSVTATIDSGLAIGGKLFGRLQATE